MKDVYRVKHNGEDFIIASCRCGCGDTIIFKVDDEYADNDNIFFMTYYNSNW